MPVRTVVWSFTFSPLSLPGAIELLLILALLYTLFLGGMTSSKGLFSAFSFCCHFSCRVSSFVSSYYFTARYPLHPVHIFIENHNIKPIRTGLLWEFLVAVEQETIKFEILLPPDHPPRTISFEHPIHTRLSITISLPP